ncbi:PIR protein [Plasmodium vivax]|uniref:VIR protein n=1 Tax=Plasmodium vivax TaxID=5855 RepID=A0A564ZQX0_PLAVI|nr:PIR protein [Plasmodium vivax]
MPKPKSCFHSNNNYLDYKCYNRLKNYFDEYGKSKGKSEKFDKIIESAKISSEDKQSNNNILLNLEQHLRGHGIFLSENEDECCKYINFWLNKEIKKKHYPLYNNSKFHIFQDFVEHFNYIVHSKDSKRCLSNIDHLDPKIWEKMSKLYELYDLYNDLLTTNYYIKYETKCLTLGHANRIHNELIKDYEDESQVWLQSSFPLCKLENVIYFCEPLYNNT